MKPIKIARRASAGYCCGFIQFYPTLSLAEKYKAVKKIQFVGSRTKHLLALGQSIVGGEMPLWDKPTCNNKSLTCALRRPDPTIYVGIRCPYQQVPSPHKILAVLRPADFLLLLLFLSAVHDVYPSHDRCNYLALSSREAPRRRIVSCRSATFFLRGQSLKSRSNDWQCKLNLPVNKQFILLCWNHNWILELWYQLIEDSCYSLLNPDRLFGLWQRTYIATPDHYKKYSNS